MVRLLALIILALCASCGGGGHAFTPYMPPQPTTLRTDLFYGYYLNTSKQQALDTADHVNLVHEALTYNGIDVPATIDSMRAHGKPTMLLLTELVYTNWPNYVPQSAASIEANLEAAFDAFKAAGVLGQVVALYPIDEPEAQHLTDAQVTQVNAAVRRAASHYAELADVKLAVIYGTNRGYGTSRGTPGIASYDWIGADDYDEGPGILISEFWTALMSNLRPGQQVMLVPGGVSPWRADPEAFRRYAHSEPRVAVILPFLWHHPDPAHAGEGIDSNGMASTYRALGQSILAAHAP